MKEIFVLLTFFSTICVVVAQLPVGASSFQVISPVNNKTIDVPMYIPPGATQGSTIVIVMHGAGDNGVGMRNAWIGLANQYRFIILAPYFPPHWTGTYQIAGLNGNTADYEHDSLDIVFDEAKRRLGSTVPKYYVYGMSAGCQYVHRMSTFTTSTKIKAVVCAAAGFYTFPTMEKYFPYFGLKYAFVPPKLSAHFCRNTWIIVGGADTTRDSALMQGADADAQGLNRLARAQNYYEFSKATAAQQGLTFNWRFHILPGVTHDNGPQAVFAAAEFAKRDQSGVNEVCAASTTTTTTTATTTKPTTTTTTTTTTKPTTTTTKPLPSLTCAGAIDLVFVIDASDTMTATRFAIIKTQLASAITQSNITWGDNNAHVGIVLSTGLFKNGATTPYRHLDLSGCQFYADYCEPTVTNTATLLAAVNNMNYAGGKNSIALSMSETMTGETEGLPDSWYIFGQPYWGTAGDRPSVPDVVIVISGADTSNVAPVRDQLLARGIRVYSIGFADLPSAQLQAISGNPARTFSIAPTDLAATIKNICQFKA